MVLLEININDYSTTCYKKLHFCLEAAVTKMVPKIDTGQKTVFLYKVPICQEFVKIFKIWRRKVKRQFCFEVSEEGCTVKSTIIQ